MRFQIAYAHGWSLARRMTQPINTEGAARRHVAGKPYAAVLHAGHDSVAAVVVNLGFRTVIVKYLARDLRSTHSHIYWLDKRDLTRMSLHEMSFFEVPVGAGPRPAKFHFLHHECPWVLRASIPDAEGSAPLRDIVGTAPAAWEEGLFASVPNFSAHEEIYRPGAFDPLDFRFAE